jgi:hypothetical protein
MSDENCLHLGTEVSTHTGSLREERDREMYEMKQVKGKVGGGGLEREIRVLCYQASRLSFEEFCFMGYNAM